MLCLTPSSKAPEAAPSQIQTSATAKAATATATAHPSDTQTNLAKTNKAARDLYLTTATSEPALFTPCVSFHLTSKARCEASKAHGTHQHHKNHNKHHHHPVRHTGAAAAVRLQQ